MKKLLPFIALFVALPVFAQYKCAVGGAVKYSDVPCAANAQNVGALQDRLTLEAQAGRARVVSRESAMLNGIERENAAYAQQQQRYADAVAAQDRIEAGVKARRCAYAQADQKYADRAVARYRDFGLQNSANQAKKEQDAASSRVRDECN